MRDESHTLSSKDIFERLGVDSQDVETWVQNRQFLPELRNHGEDRAWTKADVAALLLLKQLKNCGHMLPPYATILCELFRPHEKPTYFVAYHKNPRWIGDAAGLDGPFHAVIKHSELALFLERNSKALCVVVPLKPTSHEIDSIWAATAASNEARDD